MDYLVKLEEMNHITNHNSVLYDIIFVYIKEKRKQGMKKLIQMLKVVLNLKEKHWRKHQSKCPL